MTTLPPNELLALFAHFLSLSVFATGGVIALATDMHRYVVDERGYITHTQFVNAIALGQSAPGPNILFVTVMGWLIGGLPGALATTFGIALPSLVFPVLISRASRMAQFDRFIKALQRGLSPVAVGLMASTSLLLIKQSPGVWKGAAITAVGFALLAWLRIPPLLLIAAAGIIGACVDW